MGFNTRTYFFYNKIILYLLTSMASITELGFHILKVGKLDNDFEGLPLDQLLYEQQKYGACLLEGRPSENGKYVVYDTARLSGEAIGIEGDQAQRAVGGKGTYARHEIPSEYGVIYLPVTPLAIYHPTLIERVIDASDVTILGYQGGEDPTKIDGERLVLPPTEAGKVHKPDKLRDLLNSRMKRRERMHGGLRFRKSTCRGMETQYLNAYREADPLHQVKSGLVLHEIRPGKRERRISPEPPSRVLVFPSFHHLEAPEGSIQKNDVYVLYEAPNKSIAVAAEVDNDGQIIGIDNQDHPEKLDKTDQDARDYFSWVHDAIYEHDKKYYGDKNTTIIFLGGGHRAAA
jgi:hypothetical protein